MNRIWTRATVIKMLVSGVAAAVVTHFLTTWASSSPLRDMTPAQASPDYSSIEAWLLTPLARFYAYGGYGAKIATSMVVAILCLYIYAELKNLYCSYVARQKNIQQ